MDFLSYLFSVAMKWLGPVALIYTFWVVLQAISTATDKTLRKIPGPFWSAFTVLPLKIAILTGRRNSYIHDLHEKYGPYVRIAPKEVAIADIEAFRAIHRVGSDFNKGPWYKGQNPAQTDEEHVGVFNILNNKTASHRRRLFQTAGTKKMVAEWEPQVIELSDLAVKKIKSELEKHGSCDVQKWWYLLASDVTGSLAFGEPFYYLKTGERGQMVNDVDVALVLVALRAELPWIKPIMDCIPAWIPKSPNGVFKRFVTYGQKAVQDTRKAQQGNKKTLFSKMLLEDASEQALRDSMIEFEAVNVIIAGTETSASILAYVTYAVLRHPDVKRRLVDELKSCSPRPTWAELESFPYLNAVLEETIRLFPAIGASLPRIVPRGGEKVGKYVIPAGTQVSTQAWTFQRDPKVFKDPLRFNPDRWQNPTPEMKEHMMTFGGPARSCVGQNIARLELLHAVSKLFRECPNIALAPSTTDESMEMVDFFVSKPKSGKCVIIPSQ